ncbi:hypothetical protein [Streptomyces sp. NPDC002088]|uniref:hypothetical protein n=1 Tax=Streptomyces sp. NPDC002088 TaxID=3154665 RepID=UPI00332F93EF
MALVLDPLEFVLDPLDGVLAVVAVAVFLGGVVANYPSLVAAGRGLKGASFKNVNYSGATIADLTAKPSTDNGINAAQLKALSPETRLVTLGIGGNDIGFRTA